MFGCRLACDLAACDKDTNSPSESRRRRRDLIQKRRAEQPQKASASRGGVTEVTVVAFFFFSLRLVFFFYKYRLRLTLGRRKNTRCVLSTTASWCLFFSPSAKVQNLCSKIRVLGCASRKKHQRRGSGLVFRASMSPAGQKCAHILETLEILPFIEVCLWLISRARLFLFSRQTRNSQSRPLASKELCL